MDNIRLVVMTRALCHELYSGWVNDDSIYMDISLFKPFFYDEACVNRYFYSKQEPSRVLFAIMLGDRPVGELQFKQIDRERKECTLSIHMQNGAVKGKGYGKQAERLAIQYAFDELEICAVNADSVIKTHEVNTSWKSVGFRLVREEHDFRYYRIER